MRLIIAAWLLVGAVSVAFAKLPLLPQPQEVTETGGSFALGPDTRIAFLPDDPDLRFAAQMAADELHGKVEAREPQIVIGLPAESEAFATLWREVNLEVPAPSPTAAEEAYALSVTPSRILIAAHTPTGAFYGVQTLLQLAEIGGRKAIPCAGIRDWPAMRWRGALTDQSRQAVPKVETYQRLIRELARYKMNFVTMHLEHTFEVKKHPAISAGTGALTADDVRELCTYARQYHMLFFPSFEAFGHQSHIFEHPEYADLAESDWKYSFCPTAEGTYQLLGDMFDEMCAAFTGTDFFNAGSDEVGDLGAGKSKALAEQIGKPALYARHMNRVYQLLKARGKRMMMWGDMLLQHPEAMDLIPKDTVIMDWHYGAEHDYPSIAQFQEKGFEVIVCPALSSWCRLFPDYDLALENMEWLIRRGRERNVLGSMTCNWGDDGNENLIAYAYYGWLFAAECSWGAQKEAIDRGLFDQSFCRQFFGTDSGAPAKALHALTQADLALSRDSTYNYGFFHDDPFNGRLRTAWPREKQWAALRTLEESARQELAAAGAGRNQDVADSLDFAARRTLFVADKAERMAAARTLYQEAYLAVQDQAEALRRAEGVLNDLRELRDALVRLKEEFAQRWAAENHHEGIEYDLGKFDGQLRAFDDHIARLEKACADKALPDPAAVDLDDRQFRRALKSQVADLPKPETPWAIPAAATRIPLEIAAGKHDRVDASVLVELPVGSLMREMKTLPPGWQGKPPAEARGKQVLMVRGQQTPVQIVPSTEGTPPLAAFVLPGKLAAGETVRGELYVWQEGQAASEEADGIFATEAEGNVAVKCSVFEALVGVEGAHVYTWKLTALNGLDITEPGEAGWAGFFDDPRYRTVPLKVSVVAEGPVVAIVHAEEEGGYSKDFHFWMGLPYAEAVYSDAAGQTWSFDATANFAADAASPGTAYLSNGFSGPVPASTELRQVPQGGAAAWWCCKTRPDGLTLGYITPAGPTNMMVGPGGGWGGVGIEGSSPAQYFVTYCGVDKRGPQAVEEVFHTLARDDPMRVTFGKAETKA